MYRAGRIRTRPRITGSMGDTIPTNLRKLPKANEDVQATVNRRVGPQTTIVDSNEVEALVSVFDLPHALVIDMDVTADKSVSQASGLVTMDDDRE